MERDGAAILRDLDGALSQDAGDAVLWNNQDCLTDMVAATLFGRARDARESGDRFGAEEFEGWAHQVRSLLTRAVILAHPPSDVEEGMRLLRTQQERYDDPFIDLWVTITSSKMRHLQELIETLDPADAAGEDTTRAVLSDVTTEAGLLWLIAGITNQPRHRAHAALAQGTILLFQAQFLERQGQPAEAAQARVEATARLHVCADDPTAPASLRARALSNLAAAAGRERLDDVRAHQEAAQRAAEESGDLDVLRTVRRDRAYWAEQAADWASAAGLYRQNIEDTERALWNTPSPILGSALVQATIPDYAALVRVSLEQATRDPALYHRALEYADQGKARAFLRTLASVGGSLGAVPPRLRQRRDRILQDLRELGGLLAGVPSEVAEQQRPRVRALQQALGVAEQQIDAYTTVRAIDAQCKPCTWDEMGALAPPDGVILSFFSLEDRLLLWVLDSTGPVGPPRDIALSREELARVIVNVELMIGMRADYAGWDAIQRRLDRRVPYFWPTDNLMYLYHHLIEPVRPLLAGRRVAYIIPHGSLKRLPFPALLRPDGTALIDEIAVAYAPSLAILAHCQRQHRTALTTCFAAGVRADHAGPPRAEEEAAAVAALFGTHPRPATRAALLGEGSQCTLIHLSAHSTFGGTQSGNVVTSFEGLALEDGPLTPLNIAAMDCRASLVTLSACNTAQADLLLGWTTEMAGLIGAFMRAGCPSVMASLWPVADAVAPRMASAFYSALQRNGVSAAEALQEAQRAIKARVDEGYDHPYFWAPLSLWGAL